MESNGNEAERRHHDSGNQKQLNAIRILHDFAPPRSLGSSSDHQHDGRPNVVLVPSSSPRASPNDDPHLVPPSVYRHPYLPPPPMESSKPQHLHRHESKSDEYEDEESPQPHRKEHDEEDGHRRMSSASTHRLRNPHHYPPGYGPYHPSYSHYRHIDEEPFYAHSLYDPRSGSFDEYYPPYPVYFPSRHHGEPGSPSAAYRLHHPGFAHAQPYFPPASAYAALVRLPDLFADGLPFTH
jgi:hypothetical protein